MLSNAQTPELRNFLAKNFSPPDDHRNQGGDYRCKRDLLSALPPRFAAFIALAAPAHADALSDIKAAGKIRIAIDIGVPLFSYIDVNLQPAGSDVENRQDDRKDLGVQLELVQRSPNAARVPTIQTHKADILVGNLAITAERKKVVDFTVPYATLESLSPGPRPTRSRTTRTRRQAHRRPRARSTIRW